MDTDSLDLFVLAAEKLNISAAGRDLGLAPAVASARLAKLERAVGADLLHRSTRKVSLSLEGAEFLPYAREILAQRNAALEALGKDAPTVSGTLRFAAPSSFAQLYIAPLLPEFLDRYPAIRLDLRWSDTRFDLIEGGFDLALRNTVPEDSALKGRLLARDRRVLCAAPAYLARWGVPTTVEDLHRHRLIAFGDGSGRDIVGPDGATATIGARADACRAIFDDGTGQRAATRAGLGISINSLWSVHEDLREGSLKRVLPDHEVRDPSALWLIYPKSNVLTTKVRVFIDFLLEKLGRRPPWEV